MIVVASLGKVLRNLSYSFGKKTLSRDFKIADDSQFQTLTVITGTSSLGEFIDYRPEIKPIFEGIYMMISAGVGLFLLGFIGCAAAVRQDRYGLWLYLSLTVTIMILQWIGAIVTFVNYPEGKKFVINTMNIYSNEEILSPCLEIDDDNKRLFCMFSGLKTHNSETCAFIRRNTRSKKAAGRKC